MDVLPPFANRAFSEHNQDIGEVAATVSDKFMQEVSALRFGVVSVISCARGEVLDFVNKHCSNASYTNLSFHLRTF